MTKYCLNSVQTLSELCLNSVLILYWDDWQLPKDGFHWENVKHLTVLLALIHDTGTAIHKSFCAKQLKLE